MKPVKYTKEEVRTASRWVAHMRISLFAPIVPYVLSAIILASGNFLSRFVDAGPGSILFRLWPFNVIYLRQFAGSQFTTAEIRWFFTVVACSNLVWLGFFCWKFLFELFRTDVAFPSGNTKGLKKFLIIFFSIFFVLLVLMILWNFNGFETWVSPLGASLAQSIAMGAFKVVMLAMAFQYIAAAYVLEFGGLGLRYLLAKKVR